MPPPRLPAATHEPSNVESAPTVCGRLLDQTLDDIVGQDANIAGEMLEVSKQTLLPPVPPPVAALSCVVPSANIIPEFAPMTFR